MKKCICLPILCLVSLLAFSQTWTSLGQGIPNGFSNQASVLAIIEYNGILFAGGSITTAGGVNVNGGLAEWDGYNWHPGALSLIVRQFLIFNNELYAAGNFGIKKYVNDTTWADLGTGVDNGVNAVCIYNNQIIVGGGFTHAGGIAANHIAKWDGNSWSALNGGCDNTVHGLAVRNNILYVFGQFAQVDGVLDVNYAAQWNGSSWNSIPGLTTATLSPNTGPAIAYHDTVYFWGGNENVYRYAGDSARIFIPASQINGEPVSFNNVFDSLYFGFQSNCGSGAGTLSYVYNGSSLHSYTVSGTGCDLGAYCFGEYNCQLVASGTHNYNSFARLWQQPKAAFTAQRTTSCQNDTVMYADTICQGVTSRQWIFAGGTPNTSTDESPTVVYAQPGLYTVSLVVTNPAGSDTLQFPNYITVTVAPTLPTITQIGNILVSSSSTGNQWYRNDTLLPNTTHLDTLPTPIPYYQCYSVSVSNSNGCRATSDTVCFSPSNTTGINSISETAIKIFPNPAETTLYIEGVQPGAVLQITNMLGEILMQKTADTVTTTFDITHLENGMYLFNKVRFIKE